MALRRGVIGRDAWGGSKADRAAHPAQGLVRISVDTSDFGGMRRVFERAAKVAPQAVSRALNRTGQHAFTRVKRAVAKQAGVSQAAAVKYGGMRTEPSSPGNLTYSIVARGGWLPLKHFGARRTKKGVSAAPWGTRRVFPSTFFGPGGHVYHRIGKPRLPIEKLWGPAIPNEMVKGASEQAFYDAVQTVLPARLDHELGRVLAKR